MPLIDPRFNGPPGSGNGGYTAGVVAGLVGGPAEVTLRVPPPLGRELGWDGARLLDGATVVAEGHAANVDVEPPPPVAFADAEEASSRYPGFEVHAFPTCFVCGPERDDGLRIFAAPVPGTGVVAAPWVPGEVSDELVWAALDCPGAIAVGWDARGVFVLGRIAAEVRDLPRIGERCVVVARPLGEDGRKLFAATALYGEDGRLLGRARQTWIVPRR
ncbi:MAG: hypothetical protein ACM33B_10020 [Pseudomonadota bacterium]